MLAAASGVATAASMLFPPLSNAEMQFCARTDVHSHSQDDIGPDSEFKMGKTLSPLGTYPSGALRRAGASGDRAIVITVRDTRRGRRGAIYAGVAMHRSRAALLTPDDSLAGVLADLQIVLSTCSTFSFFQLARARVRGEKIIGAVALQRRINPERRNSPHARALN